MIKIMYAIVDIAGQQFKVEKGKKIFVHRLGEKEGSSVDFNKVLLIDDEGKVLIGEPYIEGAYIEAKVLGEIKGDKVIVFKKKRRKGYKVKNGHRQQFSQIEILGINEKGFVKKEKKEEKPVVAEAKAEAGVKVAEEKPAVRTTAKKKTAEAKPEAEAKTSTAAKKPAVKKTETAKKTTTASKTAADKKPAAPKTKTTTAKSTASEKKTTATKTAAKKPAAAKKTTAASKSTTAKKTTAAKPKAAPGAKKDAEKKTDKE